VSLQGVRVALTASRERSEAISFLLEDEGAELLHLPVLELLPPLDPRPFAAMVEQLQRYPWILLSSLEAVTALWEGARVAGTLNLIGKVGLIATDAAVARMLVSLGQPARIEVGPSTALELELGADAEVLVPMGDASSPWPARLAEAGALAISVLAWRPAPLELPTQAPELILFDAPGAASALHRDHRPWLETAVRVAGSASTAEELSRLGTPAHTVARAGSLGLLDAAQTAWKR
jgi:uroporphyrinogen-III synthase